MKFSIMKRTNLKLSLAIVLLFVIGVIMPSCNKKGTHRTIVCDKSMRLDVTEKYNTAVVDLDSIEEAMRRKCDSLSLKEHRVYYVDFSYSMVSKENKNINGTNLTLLDLVKKRLKQSIREIKGEDVVIEIIPFLDAELWKEDGEPTDIFKITKNSTFGASELEEMDAFIDKIHAVKKPNGTHYNTHHSIVISDFLKNRIKDEKRYHMMILLTDGEDESKFPSGASVLDGKWDICTEGKYVFGIFVNLMENKEISGDLPNRFKGDHNNKKRRFYKKGLGFDFDIFRIEPKAIIEHRRHNIAYIPIGGTIPVFIDTVQCDKYYKYTLIQPNCSSSYVKIRVDTLTPAKERPNLHRHTLYYDYRLDLKNNETNTEFIPSGHEIEITVIDEKTPNIKLLIPNRTKDVIPCVSGKLGFCKKLGNRFKPEWSDTITIKIPYEKSNDAKFKAEFNKIKLTISDIPEWAKLISDNEIYLNKPSDTVSITIALDPSNDLLFNRRTFESCINITGTEGLKAIFVNNLPLDQVLPSNKIGVIKIETIKHKHPFVVFLSWFIPAIIILWLVIVALIMAYRAMQPRFKIPAFQFGTIPSDINRNLNPNTIVLKQILEDKYLKKYICSIQYDINTKTHESSTWGISNWWNIKRAIRGDVHKYHLDENIFIKKIELRPSNEGVKIYVDGEYKDTMTELNVRSKIAQTNNDILYVNGYEPVVIN